MGNGFDRTIVLSNQSRVDSSEDYEPIPQVDGSSYSRPSKRQRIEDKQEAFVNGDNASSAIGGDQMDGAAPSLLAPTLPAMTNPDAIDVDLSDEEDNTIVACTDPRSGLTSLGHKFSIKCGWGSAVSWKPVSRRVSLRKVKDGGVKLNPDASLSTPIPSKSSLRQRATDEHESATASSKLSHSLPDPMMPEVQPQGLHRAESKENKAEPPGEPASEPQIANTSGEVSEEMRAQLAALSSNFTTKERIEVSPPLPFPETITNKTTHFLALGKADYGQEFLQLLEVYSMTSPNEEVQRPLKLSYDLEWLAIQRVFASELQLGGVSTDRVSPHRGDTYYREQIEREQEWVEEHVAKAGKLQVPQNFAVTAPVYDPNEQVAQGDMPREVTNPQTSAYCELIGIANKFDMSEKDRDFRMQQGPRPESAEYHTYHNRPQRGGSRGRGGHRGGTRAGRGGGRGRGRGRGY